MKIHHYLLITTALFTHSLSADTFILKSGIKYDGKILSENATSYLIEIRVTPTIKDERRIPKDQIKKIIKAAPDAEAFSKVKSLVPTPDRLPLSAYASRINTAKKFLSDYPTSSHRKEVKTIIETLEKEQQTITQGGIKLSGQLISPTDMEANAYDIHARILLLDIKKLSAKGLYQQALRKWEYLKKNYPHAAAYKTSIPIAKRILRAHHSQLKQLIKSLDARLTKRESAIKSLKPDDRTRTINLLAERKKTYDALIEKEEKELRTRWLTIDPFSKKAMEYNLRNAESELNALSSSNTSQFTPAGPTFRGAWAALAKNNLEEAAKLIQQLEQLQLPKKYTDPLAKKLKEKQAIQATEKKQAEERAEQERIAKEAAEKADAEKKNGKKKPQGK